jgi:hypothetical protein
MSTTITINDRWDDKHQDFSFIYIKPRNTISVSFEIENDVIGYKAWRLNFDHVTGKVNFMNIDDADFGKYVEFSLPGMNANHDN